MKANDFSIISNETVGKLRRLATAAEAEGRLVAEQLSVIYEKKWFKLFVPQQLGGLGLSVPEGVRLEEELARIDGSLGWTVTLCAGANLFVGYLDRDTAAPIFEDPRVCLGGSGQASGTATLTNGGYEVTGKWHYATGAPHNTHFTANCVIQQNGKPVLDNAGQPLVKSFFFDRKDVHIIPDWNTFGLRATASHSFEVDRCWVPESRGFLIAPNQATWDLPVYRYPFMALAQTTLAINTLGMTRHFMECCEPLAAPMNGRSNAPFAAALARAHRRVNRAKHTFYQVLDKSWDEMTAQGTPMETTLQAVAETSRSLVGISREAVVTLYPYCGIAAADASSAINRVWRDLFTASQHSLFR